MDSVRPEINCVDIVLTAISCVFPVYVLYVDSMCPDDPGCGPDVSRMLPDVSRMPPDASRMCLDASRHILAPIMGLLP